MSPLEQVEKEEERIDDPIAMAILGGRLRSVVDDMATILANTARSAELGVQRQFGCGLLDAGGELVAVDNPRYLATLQASAKACIEGFEFDLDGDDVIFTNDAFGGAPTVQYFTVVKPVPLGEDFAGYIAVQARMCDVGGMVLGNCDPEAEELRTEGVIFTPMRLERYGRLRRDIHDTLLFNSRLPERFGGDLGAILGAIRIGGASLDRLFDRYGHGYVVGAMSAGTEYAERRMRGALARIPDGSHRGEALLREDGRGGENLKVAVTLVHDGERTVVDFTGTSPQSRGFVNCSEAAAQGAALLTLLGLLGGDIPYNGGLLRALEFVLPPGSLVSPQPPAPSGWSTEHVAFEIGEATRRALEAALPEATPPGLPSRDMVRSIYEEKRWGATIEQLGLTDLALLAQAGAGAAPDTDGWGQPGTEALSKAPSIEEFERESAFRIKSLEYRTDSAGAGRWRGGLGVTAEIGLPAKEGEHLYCVPVNKEGGPPGLSGGLSGDGSEVLLIAADGSREAIDGGTAGRSLTGYVGIEIHAAGGGGYGEPGERSAEAVGEDVADGLLSVDVARSIYDFDPVEEDAL